MAQCPTLFLKWGEEVGRGWVLGFLLCLTSPQAQRKPGEPSATPFRTLSLMAPRSHSQT